MRSDGQRTAIWVAAGSLLAAGVVATSVLANRPPQGNADSAPGRTARRRRFGNYAVTGRAITIFQPRQDVYAFWRNFSNLPKFMENLQSVQEMEDGRTRWLIKAPGGTSVAVMTRIVQDRPGEEIAWRSTEDSDVDTEGKVAFREAPGGRGTIVSAIIAYKPPGGEVGRLLAKVMGREPGIQARRELKRLKMLMETGEIATARNRLVFRGKEAG